MGMTPGLLAALRPHLTLFGAPVPNRADADPEVAAALAISGDTGPTLGAAPNGAFDLVTVRIHATAYGPGNARVSRTAVARVGTNLPQGYTLLACRAARALLNWSQEDLVRACGITKKTIADFERGATTPRPQTLSQIAAALEAAGVEFLDGTRPGVRFAVRQR